AAAVVDRGHTLGAHRREPRARGDSRAIPGLRRIASVQCFRLRSALLIVAHIAILIDFFPGHFFPTLGLARALAQRGHRIQYLGPPDLAAVVREQDYEFTEIMADLLPRGSAEALRREAGLDPENEKLMVAAQQRYF